MQKSFVKKSGLSSSLIFHPVISCFSNRFANFNEANYFFNTMNKSKKGMSSGKKIKKSFLIIDEMIIINPINESTKKIAL